MATKESLYLELARIFNKDAGFFNDDIRFREDLSAKSMHLFAVVAAIEELTDNEVSFNHLRGLTTVGELLPFLQ
jgi:acyl carrier protein